MTLRTQDCAVYGCHKRVQTYDPRVGYCQDHGVACRLCGVETFNATETCSTCSDLLERTEYTRRRPSNDTGQMQSQRMVNYVYEKLITLTEKVSTLEDENQRLHREVDRLERDFNSHQENHND